MVSQPDVTFGQRLFDVLIPPLRRPLCLELRWFVMRMRLRPAETSTTNSMLLLLLAAIALGFGCTGVRAQDAYSIRVEPHQVVVPAFVFVKEIMKTLSQKERDCTLANAETFYKIRLSDPYKPADCDQATMRDLTQGDFHVLEDGVEQKIQDVALQRVPIVNVRDSDGWHVEFSATPIGRWSTNDLGPLLVPGDSGTSDGTGWRPGFSNVHSSSSNDLIRYLPGDAGYFYRIAYVPPSSQEGSCHKVQVETTRPNAVVFARSEYCNVRHAPSDPLQGTKLGDLLLSDASSGKKGDMQAWMRMQTATFLTAAHGGRVDIALTFPWTRFRHEWKQGRLVANIGVLGLVYDLKGNQVLRFSDFGCCSDDRPDFMRGKHSRDEEMKREPTLLPSRYDGQIELPAGEYKLRLVLGDLESFGVAESLFSIEPYDGAALAVSSLILCNRYRDANAAEQEDAAASLAPLYLPLVSKGAEFLPASTSRSSFRRLFAYFDVEDAQVLGGSAKVQMQLKVVRVKYGEVELDLVSRDLSSLFATGSAVAHVAQEIGIDKLRPGSYRIEVQASDSLGRTSAARSANFDVE